MTSNKHDDELSWLAAQLELQGAVIEHWPDAAARERARAVVERDARARTLVTDAARIDVALAAWSAPAPSAELRRAVAEIPLRHPRVDEAMPHALPVWFPFRSLAPAVMTAAFALALGVWAGLAVPDELAGVASTDTSMAEASDGWSELSALAFAGDLEQELAP